MDKNEVIAFFDSCADSWDTYGERREDAISLILSQSGVRDGAEVLDVGCGTGVLFPDYIRMGASVTGIDISPKMTERAKSKFPGVNVICGDAQDYSFEGLFDVIMIHNAFPHFPDPERLIKHLSGFLKKEGRLTVAHSISEKEVAECHSGSAKNVSLPLLSNKELSGLMSAYLEVDVSVSDDRMYMVSGVKKCNYPI